MGCMPKISSSSFDTIPRSVNPNPDPTNYIINSDITIHGYLILDITYRGCTNFEGNKILVFDHGVTIDKLINQYAIDPHFSDNTNMISPIARFVPTDKGWDMAMHFAKTYCRL